MVRFDVNTCPGCGKAVAAYYLLLDRKEQIERLKDEDPAETIEILENYARINNIDIQKDLDESLPIIASDQAQLQQVFLNLISNAIDAVGKEGRVEVKSRQVDSQIQVAIKDTGPGIRQEDMNRLFQQFVQLETPSERKVGSSGLGLAISKEIIEAHKGKIWVESQVGNGSTFSFVLPVQERRQ